jgi:hypothetical protein
MIFGLWKRSETDSTKIVSYTASAAGVCVARVAYEDIRQAFGLPGVSNELLRARANARVTNKKALSEIATSLLEAGQAKRIYDYLVVDISRSDLATRKKEFAWSEDDIPESMGLEAKPTTVPFSQFELESDIVYQLLMSLGYRHVFLCNPNEGQKFESGADVSTNLENRLTGFQVKEYRFDLGTGKKGSKARGEESRKAADGLPAPMWVKPLSMPALIHLVREAAKKGWSEKDFPDMSLLIAASIPQLGGTGSTFLYKPSLSVDEMNAQLFPILERTKYSAAYLYLVMWRSVYKWTREGGWKMVL